MSRPPPQSSRDSSPRRANSSKSRASKKSNLETVHENSGEMHADSNRPRPSLQRFNQLDNETRAASISNQSGSRNSGRQRSERSSERVDRNSAHRSSKIKEGRTSGKSKRRSADNSTAQTMQGLKSETLGKSRDRRSKSREERSSQSKSRRQSDITYDAIDEWDKLFQPLNNDHYLNELSEVTSLAGRDIPLIPMVRQAGFLPESLEFASMFTPSLTRTAQDGGLGELDEEALENERLGFRYDVEQLKREKDRAKRHLNLEDAYRIGEWRTGIRMHGRKLPKDDKKVLQNSDNSGQGYGNKMAGPRGGTFRVSLETKRLNLSVSSNEDIENTISEKSKSTFGTPGSFRSTGSSNMTSRRSLTSGYSGSVSLSSVAENHQLLVPLMGPKKRQDSRLSPKGLNF